MKFNVFAACLGTFMAVCTSLKAQETLLLAGDSYAEGLAHTFIKQAKTAGYKPVVHSIRGSTAGNWVRLIQKDMKFYRPKVVFVTLGVNDATRSNVWLQKHSSDYALIVEHIENGGGKPLWIQPPLVSKTRVHNTNEVRKILVALPCFSYDTALHQLRMSPDGIHPTYEGYASWMKAAWNLSQILGFVNGE